MIRHALAATSLSTLALATIGCSLHHQHHDDPASPTSYSYSATASVGDFVTIVVDEVAHTITYDNQSTGETGVASFHAATDGSYVIDSDTGTMAPQMAYEVPGYAFIMAANHTGPSGVPSIITAIHTQSIAVSDLAGSYNYMQFRTNSGGVEIGDVQIDSTNIVPNSYSPGQGGSPFHSGSMPVSSVGAHGTYLTLPDTDGMGNPIGNDYIFRTTDGFFAVDTTNGALVCLQKAASKIFSPANAGTYHAMVFGKANASTGAGNVESPATGTLAKYAISISNGGTAGAPIATVTVTDQAAPGTPVVDHQDLTPLDDTALHGPTAIVNSCPGAFTATAGSTQYFVIFLSDSLLIAAYTDNGNGTYDYWYGVGLRDPANSG